MPLLRPLLLSMLVSLMAPACSSSQPPGTAQPAGPQATPAVADVRPYTLKDTEVRKITSRSQGRSYDVLVSFPESYRDNPNHRFPVVFVADANYAFPLMRSLAARVGSHGAGLEDFVLVGLAYAEGDTPEYSRRRDYTPTVPRDGDYTSDMPGRTPAFGGAAAYQTFIHDEVFPLVARHYRVDMGRKIFAGHSYGALLGTQILLTQPTMFSHYILSSPSLWFDDKVLMGREGDYARAHGDMVAEVFLTAGSFETIASDSSDRRYNQTADLVRDMQAFHRQLQARNYPGLRIQSQVLAGEDHLSGNPNAFTRGLKWALPPRP